MRIVRVGLWVLVALAVGPLALAGQVVQAARYAVGDETWPVDTVANAMNITREAVMTAGVPLRFKDVAFSVGIEYSKGTHPVDVSTNLPGAAIGSAFDAIGSKELKDYLTNNLTAGFAVPTDGEGGISGSLAIGLGGFRLGNALIVVPTLSFEQTDTVGGRVPVDIVSEHVDQNEWTRPSLALTVVSPDLWDIVAAGELGLAFTVGIHLPHYYSGNAFEALGALFTADRQKYERGGSPRFFFGIGVPLLRVNKLVDQS